MGHHSGEIKRIFLQFCVYFRVHRLLTACELYSTVTWRVLLRRQEFTKADLCLSTSGTVAWVQLQLTGDPTSVVRIPPFFSRRVWYRSSRRSQTVSVFHHTFERK